MSDDTAFGRRMAELVEQERSCVHAAGALRAPEAATQSFADLVWRELREIGSMLVEKNRAYGNSALDPVRIFSRADRLEQLKVRIDDKLSRIAKGHAAGEELTGDLIGYLVLLRIAEKGGGDQPSDSA